MVKQIPARTRGRIGFKVNWLSRQPQLVGKLGGVASRAGYFALNIDTLNGMADTFKREVIAREILVCIGALPQ